MIYGAVDMRLGAAVEQRRPLLCCGGPLTYDWQAHTAVYINNFRVSDFDDVAHGVPLL